MTKKTLLVSAINSGTVIDHISSGQALRIIQILDLASGKQKVTVGINLQSKSMGIKDIIKLENKRLSSEEAKQVAVFSPYATINIIENYLVEKRFKVSVPRVLKNLLRCPNSFCITNRELMGTHFDVKKLRENIHLHCKYCEKFFLEDEIKA